MRAHSYSLLRTILNTALADDIIAANPCRVRGAGSAKRARQIRPATLAELETLVTAMPGRYRLMVLLAAWCAMRFGELTELRRSDIDVRSGVVHIRRGVVRTDAGRIVKDPKSEAGKRDVAIPPHLIPAVKAHLAEHVAVGPDALVFPAAAGDHMAPSALDAVYHPAREAAGRPDLRFHDLRHTGAVLAAAREIAPDLPPSGRYESELGLAGRAWVGALAGMLEAGVVLLVDYGFPAREYYHPQRSMGTLMCHYRHRAHGDPFYLPGLQDITAHVDFSALAHAAADAGLDVLGYASQADFLLNCGITDILGAEDASDARHYAPLAAQAQKLLSPAEMGELFKVLALGRGVARPLAGFTRADRSHTL